MSQAKTIMLQGTASHVGKSLLCTALCRIFRQDGWQVAPFKAQNMSLNSYVTLDGGEIGQAQAIQALAAGIVPTVEMSPVLLKPRADMHSQVVLLGKTLANMSARDYRANFLLSAIDVVQQCLDSLRQSHQIVVIEGAGSPAEINLKDRDIVNMRTAFMAEAPVILVADIDRGGVFASLVGTLELLEPQEREQVAGFIINKFRGDIELLRPGLDWLEQRTGKPVLGVLPYLPDHGIAEEDSVGLSALPHAVSTDADLDVAIIELPRIANFTEFDALRDVPGVGLRLVGVDDTLGRPDAIILPSTNSPQPDLLYLQEQGLAAALRAAAADGVAVFGCGAGYYLLGQELICVQPEGAPEKLTGIGLLPISTTISAEAPVAHQCTAVLNPSVCSWPLSASLSLAGFWISSGQVELAAGAKPWLTIISRSGVATELAEGAISDDGRIMGTQLQGLLANPDFLLAWLNSLRAAQGLAPLVAQQLPLVQQEERFDRLAAAVRQHLDLEQLAAIMGL